MRSTNKSGSRYVQGGETTVYQERLGWWERRSMPKDVSDANFIITDEYDRRPSKLAYDHYGKSGLMWFILQYNVILDINTEFVSGARILLPQPARVELELLNRQPG